MATLTVWKFDTAEGAEGAVRTLEELSKAELITIHDAATVTWEAGKKKPKTRQLRNLAGAGALGGAFWGLLFGLIFFVPLLGAAIGAATGALSGSLADVGIDDSFINRVRDQITPGTSALFVMTLRRRDGQGARRVRGTPALRADLHEPRPGAGERAARGLRRLTPAGPQFARSG